MSRFNKQLKHFLELIRSFFDTTPRNGQSWSGQQRWAQSPSAPRASRNDGRPIGSYAGANAHQKRHKYTPEEVKKMLRGLEKTEWTPPVLAQAATFSALLDERMVRFFRGRERLFDRLPYVLLQYTQGRPCNEIAHSVSYFSDGEDVEDAIDFAARLIAHEVNRQYWRSWLLDL